MINHCEPSKKYGHYLKAITNLNLRKTKLLFNTYIPGKERFKMNYCLYRTQYYTDM